MHLPLDMNKHIVVKEAGAEILMKGEPLDTGEWICEQDAVGRRDFVEGRFEVFATGYRLNGWQRIYV